MFYRFVLINFNEELCGGGRANEQREMRHADQLIRTSEETEAGSLHLGVFQNYSEHGCQDKKFQNLPAEIESPAFESSVIY
jgi:hypothetical protein